MTIVTIRVTEAEARQLLSYANERDTGPDAGWYYGNKAQFQSRHESIIDVLERTLGIKDEVAQPETVDGGEK